MEKNYRHEYKFLISRASADILRLRLPHFMQRDSHAGPTGRYTIRSLYFEDLEFTAFREKVDGVDNRTKYRIRCYNYNARLLKLERKEKKGHLTRKVSQTITVKDAMNLQRCLPGLCPDHPEGLTKELHDKLLQPRILVDYDRTPFVCNAGNTRITLDENLRTRPYATDLFASPNAMVPVLDDDQVILEVKFDDYLPGYLSEALADIPRGPMAVSKFAFCMSLL